MSTRPRLQLDEALVHRDHRIRRDDIHVVGLHGLSRAGQRHGHRGFLRENLGQQAFVLRVQVLNHDEAHAGCRKRAEKLNQRLEASGRRANADDEERRVAPGVGHVPSIAAASNTTDECRSVPITSARTLAE